MSDAARGCPRDTIEIRLTGNPRDPHDRARWQALWAACIHHAPLLITSPLFDGAQTIFVKYVSSYRPGWYAWLHDLPTSITVTPP